MVRRWNEVVRQDDKVYHLGDVVIAKRHLDTIKRLNGNKRLIRGNHDPFKTKEYIDVGFKEVYGIRVLEDMVLTHVPLHPASVTERWNVNVHGHLHANIVERWADNGMGSTFHADYELQPDPLYMNVSVEQIDYRPIELSELRKLIAERREKYGTPDFGEYTHRK